MKSSVKLLYLDEHLGCENYIRENNVGFGNLKLVKENDYQIHLKGEFAVLFVTKGKVMIGVPETPIEVMEKNEIWLLSNHHDYSLTVKSNAHVTIMYFDRPNSRCDFLAFDKMSGLIKKNDTSLARKLKMNKPVADFIKGLEFYLDNKMYCRHLHDLKESEFFFLIRGFYTKEEIAYFFTPVIRSLNGFANLVQTNYLKVDTVTELAEKLNMTPKTFTRRFKSVFDATPKQWMLKVKTKKSALE